MSRWTCFTQPGEVIETITKKRDFWSPKERYYLVSPYRVKFVNDDKVNWEAKVAEMKFADRDMLTLLEMEQNTQNIPEFIRALIAEEITIRIRNGMTPKGGKDERE